MSSDGIHFEDFELDRSAYQLRRNGEVVRLERLPLDLLFLLVELRGQLVTREQIIDRLWGKDVFVDSESGINTAVRKIRRALRDDTNAPRFILTVPARGYRFAAPVLAANGKVKANDETVELVPSVEAFIAGDSRPYPSPWRAGALSAVGLVLIVGTVMGLHHRSPRPQPTHASIVAQLNPVLPLPDTPSIAVLPFANLSSDPQQEYFNDGITDDLVTDLSRLPGLFVIDRNSTFAYKGKAPTAQEVGRELGVKYILEGSARRAAERVRINVQLIEASTGDQVWSQRYDKRLVDVFALQDEIVQSLVATLNLQFIVRQKGYAFPQRTKNLEAYDYFLRGFEQMVNPNPNEGFAKAKRMFEKAIELDPSYPEPYGALSFSYFLGYLYQWDREPGVLERAANLAEKTIALDDSAAMVYALLAWIAATKGHWDTAHAYGSRAVSLQPSNAFVCLALANVWGLAGHPNRRIEFAQKGMRLDPLHSETYWEQEGFGYNEMGRYREALDALTRGNQNDPMVHLSLIWIYSRLGRTRAKQAEVVEVMRLSPHFSLEAYKQSAPFDWNSPRYEPFIAELRKAGLE